MFPWFIPGTVKQTKTPPFSNSSLIPPPSLRWNLCMHSNGNCRHPCSSQGCRELRGAAGAAKLMSKTIKPSPTLGLRCRQIQKVTSQQVSHWCAFESCSNSIRQEIFKSWKLFNYKEIEILIWAIIKKKKREKIYKKETGKNWPSELQEKSIL